MTAFCTDCSDDRRLGAGRSDQKLITSAESTEKTGTYQPPDQNGDIISLDIIGLRIVNCYLSGSASVGLASENSRSRDRYNQGAMNRSRRAAATETRSHTDCRPVEDVA